MNGSGIPLVGTKPSTTLKLISACPTTATRNVGDAAGVGACAWMAGPKLEKAEALFQDDQKK